MARGWVTAGGLIRKQASREDLDETLVQSAWRHPKEKEMLKWFRSDPTEKLEKQYARKLEEARDAQRAGKIPLFATLTAEAEEIAQRLDALERGRASKEAL